MQQSQGRARQYEPLRTISTSRPLPSSIYPAAAHISSSHMGMGLQHQHQACQQAMRKGTSTCIIQCMQPTHPCAWQEPTAKGARIRNQSAWEHKSRAAEGPAITCSGCDCCGCHMLSSTVQRPWRSVLTSRHTRLLEAARTNLHRSATLSQENSALGLETSSWTSRYAGVGKCCRGEAEAYNVVVVGELVKVL